MSSMTMNGRPCVLLDRVDGADAGMVQRRGGARLPLEALEHRRVVLQVGGEDLDRDVAAEVRVLGLVNHAHAAEPELPDDPVMRDGLPDQSDSMNLLFCLSGNPEDTTAPLSRSPPSAWQTKRVSEAGKASLVGIVSAAVLGISLRDRPREVLLGPGPRVVAARRGRGSFGPRSTAAQAAGERAPRRRARNTAASCVSARPCARLGGRRAPASATSRRSTRTRSFAPRSRPTPGRAASKGSPEPPATAASVTRSASRYFNCAVTWTPPRKAATRRRAPGSQTRRFAGPASRFQFRRRRLRNCF